MPDGIYPVRPVDHDARCLCLPLGRGDPDPSVLADGDVDDVALLVGQVVQLSCRVGAERRSRPGAQHSTPQQALSRRVASECRVDTAIERLPAVTSQAGFDDPRIHRGGRQLPARDHAMLEVKQPGAAVRQISGHDAQAARIGVGRAGP
jgi:hypothetical protein